MAQANSRSCGVCPRERFWLDHLAHGRQQGLTLKAYAQAHGLSVSALYTARSTLKRRGVLRTRSRRIFRLCRTVHGTSLTAPRPARHSD